MGASAVILFIIPHSPLAQPWPLVGGQISSACTGVVCAQCISDTSFASAVAVGGSVFAMLLLRCLHPPGAATALTPIMAGQSLTTLGYNFALIPVGLNVMAMLMMAIALNRWLLRHQYPILSHHDKKRSSEKNNAPSPADDASISDDDIDQALERIDTFVDVSVVDLRQLIGFAQMQSFKRYKGNFTCADIMIKNITTVDYGTEVEDAWKIMHREKLKAMPVIDRSKRVIGILTWNDFFKFVKVDDKASFSEKFKTFVRRTLDVKTNKPESVGHIMTSPVSVLPEKTHIADLVPLMSTQGYRQIPIVNEENRLVGMVYQAHLIAALYDHSLIGSNKMAN